MALNYEGLHNQAVEAAEVLQNRAVWTAEATWEQYHIPDKPESVSVTILLAEGVADDLQKEYRSSYRS